MATAMGDGDGNKDGVGNSDGDGNGDCNGNGHSEDDNDKERVASSCGSNVQHCGRGEHLAPTHMDTKESAFTSAASWG